MSKDKQLLNRFGANLAESMGANRSAAGQGGAPQPSAAAGKLEGTSRLRSAAEIAVGRIIPDPNQPRAEFDPESITRLAESLRSHGQLQPICVRWSDAENRYVIISGERRWRAAVEAGRATVSAIILEGERTESQILELQLIENALREDLKPVEQARAFRILMDRNTWTASRLAEVLHLNVATITRALSLLELPAPVQDRVESGELAPSVAYEISKVEDIGAQTRLADRVVTEKLNRAETISAVKEASAASPSAKSVKGRGGGSRSDGKPKPPTSRLFKTGSARVTVELRGKAAGPSAMLAALREAAQTLEAELSAPDQHAA